MKNVLDTKFYRYLDAGSSFLFLGFVWALACLPVLTLFPATVALFSVARGWVRGGDFDGAVRGFFDHFKQEFRRGFLLGLIWLPLGAVIVLNLLLAAQMPSFLQLPFSVFLVVAGLFYLASTVFLFPVAVNYDSGLRKTVRNSFLISLSQLPTTFYGLFVLVLTASLVFVFPPAIFFIGGVVAYALYFLCNRAFSKISTEHAENTRIKD